MNTAQPRMQHLEIDLHNICNAQCPLCHFRTNYPEALKTRQSLDCEFLERVLNGSYFERVHLSGDLGEPTLSPHILPVIQFLVKRDPAVFICINTHGGARDHDFWRSLARELPRRHEVVFAIDGLADTYAIYRVGLEFERTLGNAAAFIAAGGIASWSFIKFRHNQHQLPEARRLAREMGFATFHERESYAETTAFPRADDYVDNHARIAALGASGTIQVTPKLFPYIQADRTLYPCAQSNCGRYDSKMKFDFDLLDLRTRSFAECLEALPSYCRAMQETYPLTCIRRCGEFAEADRARGAEIGYGRRFLPKP
jgi:hypothetical protein